MQLVVRHPDISSGPSVAIAAYLKLVCTHTATASAPTAQTGTAPSSGTRRNIQLGEANSRRSITKS